MDGGCSEREAKAARLLTTQGRTLTRMQHANGVRRKNTRVERFRLSNEQDVPQTPKPALKGRRSLRSYGSTDIRNDWQVEPGWGVGWTQLSLEEFGKTTCSRTEHLQPTAIHAAVPQAYLQREGQPTESSVHPTHAPNGVGGGVPAIRSVQRQPKTSTTRGRRRNGAAGM